MEHIYILCPDANLIDKRQRDPVSGPFKPKHPTGQLHDQKMRFVDKHIRVTLTDERYIYPSSTSATS
jgi:hypothetical protein